MLGSRNMHCKACKQLSVVSRCCAACLTLPCCPLLPLAAVGTMTVRAADLNVTCLPVAPAAASGSGSDSGSSSGGVPAYVWAIVGVVAAAVVAAAITTALLVRRRRLRRAGSIVGVPKDPERAEEAADGAPQAGAPPQEDDSPCNSPGASTELQDGLWRSRCGLWWCTPFFVMYGGMQCCLICCPWARCAAHCSRCEEAMVDVNLPPVPMSACR